MAGEFDRDVVRPALADLDTTVVGREVLAFDSLPSTNSLLREYATAQGAAEGLIAITDDQTAGRGRRGRTWVAPAGSSLLMSLLLRPTWLAPADSFLLTILAAVAVAEAVEAATGLAVDLKWPNDVQIARRKLAGILVEIEAANTERTQWAIIGCGINVNWRPGPEVGQDATSLAEALGGEVDRSGLLRALIQAFDRQYLMLRSGRREGLRAAWLGRLTTLGQRVSVELAGETFAGTAEDIDQTGGLLVRCADGSLRRVLAGDVRVRAEDATAGGA